MGTKVSLGSGLSFRASARGTGGLDHIPPRIWKMIVQESLPVRRQHIWRSFLHLTDVSAEASRWEGIVQGHRLSQTSWRKLEWKPTTARAGRSEGREVR